MREFIKHGGILAVDKTFNLSSHYVTIITYKNLYSLYNSGNYRLQPNYRHFSMPLAEWRVLTETERNEKFVQFLRCDITLEKKYVVSSVLDVKTPAVRRRAEKPNKAKPQVRHKMRKSQISKQKSMDLRGV